jgi:hypothetical protein
MDCLFILVHTKTKWTYVMLANKMYFLCFSFLLHLPDDKRKMFKTCKNKKKLIKTLILEVHFVG